MTTSSAAPPDRWGAFASFARRLPAETLVVADARVARLHPTVVGDIPPHARILGVRAAESTKSLAGLGRLLGATVGLSRAGTLVAVGGGTIGDVATVSAALTKRGIRLIHVPTTLLAAVDSSIGGKGAIHVASGAHLVKNAAGVFHPASESWLCPEFWATLSERQRIDGLVEAYKMAVCLDADLWSRWTRRRPTTLRLVSDARALKARVCSSDPFDRTGRRAVLNFGHTFGHVLESVTGFRLSHGAAVRLGVVCALDVGRRLGVTPDADALEVEACFEVLDGRSPCRRALARAIRGHTAAAIGRLLAADKKSEGGTLRMVFLTGPGAATVLSVPVRTWRSVLPAWRAGVRP